MSFRRIDLVPMRFVNIDVTATASDEFVTTDSAAAVTISPVMPWPGLIRALSVRSSATTTGGTATYQVFKNSTDVGSAYDAVLDSVTNTVQAFTTVARTSAVRFVAGDRLDVRVTTASYAPTTADHLVTLFVELEVTP